VSSSPAALHVPDAPPELHGKHVRLSPLKEAHLDGLCAIGLDPSLWEMTMQQIRSRDDMEAYISEALRQQELGLSLPYVILEDRFGSVIGSTRFGNIAREHHRVEIGWTWVTPRWQRTAVNTEAKYLLLTCAFESFGCARVEFKTDALNAKSRKALRRIGAKEEGILRRHMVTDSDRFRDTVFYSILADEWPEVKRDLAARLV